MCALFFLCKRRGCSWDPIAQPIPLRSLPEKTGCMTYTLHASAPKPLEAGPSLPSLQERDTEAPGGGAGRRDALPFSPQA